MRLDIYVHISQETDSGSSSLLSQINKKLDLVLGKEVNLMATLQEVLDDVAAEKTVEESLITLTQGLKAQLDAITSGSLTPAQQAQVDAIFAAVEANKTEVSAAVVANTPTPPAPAPTV